MTLYDADIRDALCEFIAEKFGEVRFFDELGIGRSRADLLMISRTAFYGIEIKSDADSYSRLPRQIKDYDRYCDYNIIVAGATHVQHVQEHVPEYWGIIITDEEQDKADFYELRQPRLSPRVTLNYQLKLLWKREMADIQRRHKLHMYLNKSRSFREKYILDSLEPQILKYELIEQLFNRDYSQFDTKP